MKSGIIEQPPTNGCDIDRISELPDSVLHHILSFLETKYSVQTRILSKRWTHLWASVPALDLTDHSFIRNGKGELSDSDTHNFENFVDTVLLLRGVSDLRSFSLCLYDYFDEGRVHGWIRHATKYNPKVLQIEFPARVRCRLPLGILPCRSLEELSMTLDCNVELGPPKIMGCLRRLHIRWAFGENGSMENLISSCPVLEDLDLHNCLLDALCISSNTLKRLSIKGCKIYGNKNLISTPGLVCLTYTNNSGCTTLKNLSPLLNATVHTRGEDLIGLSRGLANVETLNFSFLEEEDYQEFSISMFEFSFTMKSGIIEQPPTKEHSNGSDIDRISDLPDYVLHHILSFLPTRDTVKTRILSKRWTHLWASVPALDLTDQSFIRNGYRNLRVSDKYNFVNFVDTVLLLHDTSNLCSFSLHCYDYFDEDHVHTWIHHATKYNPKVLQISFPWFIRTHLPLGILPCQSLEELSLKLYCVLGPPKIMGRLRRLHIEWVSDEDGSMEILISSCPVLEDLDLYNCDIDELCISSNTLKRLSIDYCNFYWSQILISTPSLVCLTYTNNTTDNNGCTTLKNLSSLLNATVHTSGEDLIGLSRGLANVETLNLSFLEDDDYEDKLPEDLSEFPIFDNLRSLTLGGQCTSDMIQVVALFLQHSPNLKKFTLNIREVSRLSPSRWKVIEKSSKLSFRCPHLQLIEIQCSRREEKIHEVIKYLLLNATGVPKIVITRCWGYGYF